MVTDAQRVTWSGPGHVQSFCLKSATKRARLSRPFGRGVTFLSNPFGLGARTVRVSEEGESSGIRWHFLTTSSVLRERVTSGTGGCERYYTRWSTDSNTNCLHRVALFSCRNLHAFMKNAACRALVLTLTELLNMFVVFHGHVSTLSIKEPFHKIAGIIN